jgi:trimethylamine:corrinoid methyltransferase-like protein
LGVQEIGWELWRNAGSPTAIERAQREAGKILSTHEVPPLTGEQERELDTILASLVK